MRTWTLGQPDGGQITLSMKEGGEGLVVWVDTHETGLATDRFMLDLTARERVQLVQFLDGMGGDPKEPWEVKQWNDLVLVRGESPPPPTYTVMRGHEVGAVTTDYDEACVIENKLNLRDGTVQ